MDAGEPLLDRLPLVADVVREQLHRPQALGDREQVAESVVELDVDVQVRVDQLEAVRLVPRVDVLVVSRPGFEADDALGASEPLGLLEQRGRDAAPLVVRVRRDVPDHPAEAFALRADRARLPLELDVDQADDLVPRRARRARSTALRTAPSSARTSS